mmetsp:Transcript_4888/g.19567  ORF Transcript_4888/g.19567 Transcript_4888/m.19567 type:complete len:744 (-) Transcript_4888:196-2427(-)
MGDVGDGSKDLASVLRDVFQDPACTRVYVQNGLDESTPCKILSKQGFIYILQEDPDFDENDYTPDKGLDLVDRFDKDGVVHMSVLAEDIQRSAHNLVPRDYKEIKIDVTYGDYSAILFSVTVKRLRTEENQTFAVTKILPSEGSALKFVRYDKDDVRKTYVKDRDANSSDKIEVFRVEYGTSKHLSWREKTTFKLCVGNVDPMFQNMRKFLPSEALPAAEYDAILDYVGETDGICLGESKLSRQAKESFERMTDIPSYTGLASLLLLIVLAFSAYGSIQQSVNLGVFTSVGVITIAMNVPWHSTVTKGAAMKAFQNYGDFACTQIFAESAARGALDKWVLQALLGLADVVVEFEDETLQIVLLAVILLFVSLGFLPSVLGFLRKLVGTQHRHIGEGNIVEVETNGLEAAQTNHKISETDGHAKAIVTNWHKEMSISLLGLCNARVGIFAEVRDVVLSVVCLFELVDAVAFTPVYACLWYVSARLSALVSERSGCQQTFSSHCDPGRFLRFLQNCWRFIAWAGFPVTIAVTLAFSPLAWWVNLLILLGILVVFWIAYWCIYHGDERHLLLDPVNVKNDWFALWRSYLDRLGRNIACIPTCSCGQTAAEGDANLVKVISTCYNPYSHQYPTVRVYTEFRHYEPEMLVSFGSYAFSNVYTPRFGICEVANYNEQKESLSWKAFVDWSKPIARVQAYLAGDDGAKETEETVLNTSETKNGAEAKETEEAVLDSSETKDGAEVKATDS